jgi:hypothetical protein
LTSGCCHPPRGPARCRVGRRSCRARWCYDVRSNR